MIRLEGTILIALCEQVLDSYSVITSYCPITSTQTWHSLKSSDQPTDSGENNEHLNFSHRFEYLDSYVNIYIETEFISHSVTKQERNELFYK